MSYFTLLTNTGIAKLSAATANAEPLKLSKIVVGDGNGSDITPRADMTTLVNQVHECNINELKTDENNNSHVIATAVIPADQGNFWIREIGLVDEQGDLIAIGNQAATHKPILEDGLVKEMILRMVIEVSNSSAVMVQMDPSIIMASKEYVDTRLTGFKNLLINGDFRVSQRGDYTSPTVIQDERYYLDRWRAWISGVDATIQHISGYPLESSKNVKLNVTTNALGYLSLCQYIESDCRGQQLTYSVWVKSNTSKAKIILYSGTWTETVSHSGNGTWEKLILRHTPNHELLAVAVGLFNDAITKIELESGEYIEVGLAQVEQGDKATNFEYRPYGLELSLCQRYYEEVKITQHSIYANSTWIGVSFFPFFVKKRITPSAVFSQGSISFGGGFKLGGINEDGFQLATASLAWTRTALISVKADAEIY